MIKRGGGCNRRHADVPFLLLSVRFRRRKLSLIRQGGTGRILEYFGPGVSAQSCTGLATIANMGAEVGATTSTFPYGSNMREYLRATGRGQVADAADEAAGRGFLEADEGAEYDEVIEVVSAPLLLCCLWEMDEMVELKRMRLSKG